MGIDRHIYGLAIGVAMAIVAIAGVFLAIAPASSASRRPAAPLYAFRAVIIGGLGSWGTLADGTQSVGEGRRAGASVAGRPAFPGRPGRAAQRPVRPHAGSLKKGSHDHLRSTVERSTRASLAGSVVGLAVPGESDHRRRGPGRRASSACSSIPLHPGAGSVEYCWPGGGLLSGSRPAGFTASAATAWSCWVCRWASTPS